jgi:alanine racemase
MAGGLERLGRLRPSQARVDLSRLAANYRAVAAWASVPVMPVVKADAYGHGAAQVGRRLESLGAPMLAVAYAEEGVALRAAGVRVPIVLLAGFGVGQEGLLAEHDLTPVVSTPTALERLLDVARAGRGPTRVHLKLDSGMARLGFGAAELPSLARRLCEAGLEIEGLATHLAAADQDPAVTARQLDVFDASIADLARQGFRPRWIHAANSAGLAQLRPTHTLARPGLLLYGIRPRPLSPAIEVRPVMTLSSHIAMLKGVPAGSAVSYEGRWVAARPSRIATIPIGYADGLPRTRAMAEHGQFLVRGGRAGVAGTVCMDLVMSDVTDVAGVEVGDEVTIFGDDPTAWEVADWAGTNAWQVLTAVGSRVPRVYVEDGRLVDVESRYLA